MFGFLKKNKDLEALILELDMEENKAYWVKGEDSGFVLLWDKKKPESSHSWHLPSRGSRRSWQNNMHNRNHNIYIERAARTDLVVD